MDTENILNLKNEAFAQITTAQTREELENIRIAYLGKNGKITKLTKRIKDISPNKRAEYGRIINSTKENIENLLFERKQQILEELEKKKNGLI